MLGTQAAGGLQGGVHPCLSPPGWGAESWAGPADPMAGQSSRVYSFLDYIMGGCQIHFTVSPRVRHAASRHTPPPTRSAPPPCPGCGSALVWQPGQRSRQTWGQRHPSAGPGGPSPPARLFLGLSLGSCSVQGAGTLGRAVARTDPPQKHSDGGGGGREGRRRGHGLPGATRGAALVQLGREPWVLLPTLRPRLT